MNQDALKNRLLEATLPNVPFEGWSETALEQGILAAGLSQTESIQTFPNGIKDLLEYFMQAIDNEMVLQFHNSNVSTKLHEKIHGVVMARFHIMQPNREAIRKALSYYAFPTHTAQGVKRLYATVDAMWRAVGDHPTDFSFYTKRAALAAIYSATLLFWLDDNSDNLMETNAFLKRRLQDHFRLHQTKEKILHACGMAKR